MNYNEYLRKHGRFTRSWFAAFLELFTRLLPKPRTYTGGNGKPYLSRWTLAKLGGCSLYLHRFHRSDEDRDLHNHPWDRSVSLVLAGGYNEYRRVGNTMKVVAKRVLPGTLNRINKDTYHRVDLLRSDAWSLFLTGGRTGGWGFWSPVTGQYVGHAEYLTAKGLDPNE